MLPTVHSAPPCPPPARPAAELLQLLGLLLLFGCMGLARSAAVLTAAAAAQAGAPAALEPVPEAYQESSSSGRRGGISGREAGGTTLLGRLLALTSAQQAQHGAGRERRRAATLGQDSEGEGEDTPLLLSPRQPAPAPDGAPAATAGARAPPASGGALPPGLSWRRLALPLLTELAVSLFELLSGRPAAVAALLCGCALIQPSAVGGCLLLVGLAVLVSQGSRAGATVLGRHPRPLLLALLLWALGCYVSTAVAPAAGSSAVAEAVGLHAFVGARERGIAGLPLLAMLFTAAAVGGLARAGDSGTGGGGGALRGSAQAQLERLLGTLYPSHPQARPSALQRVLQRVTSGAPYSPRVPGPGPGPGSSQALQSDPLSFPALRGGSPAGPGSPRADTAVRAAM